MSLEVHCFSDRNHNTDLNSANIDECIRLEEGTHSAESRDGGAAAGRDDGWYAVYEAIVEASNLGLFC